MPSKTEQAKEEQKQLLGGFSILISNLISKVKTSEEELKAAKEQIAVLLGEDAENAEEILEQNAEIKELIEQASKATPSTEMMEQTHPAQIDPPHLTDAAPVKGGVGATELTPDLTAETIEVTEVKSTDTGVF